MNGDSDTVPLVGPGYPVRHLRDRVRRVTHAAPQTRPSNHASVVLPVAYSYDLLARYAELLRQRL